MLRNPECEDEDRKGTVRCFHSVPILVIIVPRDGALENGNSSMDLPVFSEKLMWKWS